MLLLTILFFRKKEEETEGSMQLIKVSHKQFYSFFFWLTIVPQLWHLQQLFLFFSLSEVQKAEHRNSSFFYVFNRFFIGRTQSSGKNRRKKIHIYFLQILTDALFFAASSIFAANGLANLLKISFFKKK